MTRSIDGSQMLLVPQKQVEDVLSDMRFYLDIQINHNDKERYYYYLELLFLLGLVTPAVYKEMSSLFES